MTDYIRATAEVSIPHGNINLNQRSRRLGALCGKKSLNHPLDTLKPVNLPGLS
jgi:hypothetical protein